MRLPQSRYIPLIKPVLGSAELREVKGVLESGWLSQGPKVEEFEKKISNYLGARYAIATSSCTTALSLALDSLNLERGDEIVTPDFTFPATGNVIVRAGCKPVLADTDLSTYSLEPNELRNAISRRTRCVIPVHPFGHPFMMDEVYEMAERRAIEVVEDAATAFGTRYKNRLVGKKGKAVCLSFHPRKLLTTGEGGCLLTDDPEINERARMLRNHGQIKKRGIATFVLNGLNYRMSEVHAAIGIAQLGRIDRLISSRRKKARIYDELLLSSGLDVVIPSEMRWAFHTYQSYVLVLGDKIRTPRDRCIRAMRERFNVETQVGTYSLSAQPSFSNARRNSTLENARTLCSQSLTLPLYDSLTENEQTYIVDSLMSCTKT